MNPEAIFSILSWAVVALLAAYAVLSWLHYRQQGWQGCRTLLEPGQKIMQSMSLVQKFLLFGLLTLVPAMLAFSQVLMVNGHELSKIALERQGIQHVRMLMPLLGDVAQHRGMSHIALLGERQTYQQQIAEKKQQIDTHFGQSLPEDVFPSLTDVRRRWQSLRSRGPGISAEKSWSQHSDIIAGLLTSLVQIGKYYELSFDSDPGRHYLMSVFLEHLPEAQEMAGQIRGLGAGIVAGDELNEEKRFLLAGLSAKLEQSMANIASDLKLARQYNPALDERLDGWFRRYRAGIENMLFLLEHNLIQSVHINTLYFINNGLSTNPKDFFSMASKAIDFGVPLSGSAIEAFSLGLEAQSRHLQSLEEVLYYACFLCLALVIWLFYLFYSSTLSTLTSLRQLAGELRKGNINHGISAHGRDEIFAMVNVFDEIAGTLVKTIKHKNITEQKLLKLSQAVEQTSEGVLITDRDGLVEYVNRSYEQMFGFSEVELVGRPLHSQANEGHDGSLRYALSEVMAAGGAWQGETVAETNEGDSISIYCTLNPICDEQGEINHFVSTYRDMTEQKQIEEKMMLSQKMESVGTLAGGIAHDFNNALQGISGHLYLAEKNGREAPKSLVHVMQAQKLVDKAASMVKQLMAFARYDSGKKESIHFAPLLQEAIDLSRVSIPASIRLDLRLSEDSSRIVGDTTQMQQIVMNMLNNARDAVEGIPDPAIHVKSDTIIADDAFLKNHPNTRPGCYIRLSISDNGCGIPEEGIKRIFEPFYTTKGPGQGTGLGLAMVFSCMQSHEGAIDVASKPGKGTTFNLYFRVDDSGLIGPDRETEQRVVSGRQETILLVDDELTIRETGREVLENLDYRVLIAEDGVAAVEVFRAHQHEIDLVILDLVMPRMGGVEAAAQMKAIRGDVNACFATGYDLQGSIGKALPCSARDVIHKPFSVHEFSHFVRDKLERRSKPDLDSHIFDSALGLKRSSG